MPYFGDLDASFGTSGKVILDVSGIDHITSIAIDSTSGNIIVAGSSNLNGSYGSDYSLACFTSSGILDTSFGNLGKVINDFSANISYGYSVAINQTNGKIIVAGTSFIAGNYVLGLACYTSSGVLDASFGNLGKVINVNILYAYSVVIDPQSGNIIVAGNANSPADFALARYTTSGNLDTSFGSGGIVITNLSGSDVAYSVAIDPQSGKIIAAGNAYGSEFLLECYTLDGILDASFGSSGNGKVITNFGGVDKAWSVAIASNGKIIVAGESNDNFALACYTSAGILDASFGSSGNGKVTTDFNGNYDYGRSVAITHDGKIIVAGYSNQGPGSISNFALACYTSTGILDASFGTLGKVTTDFGGIDNALSVAIDPTSGKIIAAGDSSNNFALACYWGENIEVPISSVCFPANTLISTNQGNIAIQNLDPKIHTIRNKKIVIITKTVTQDKYLVCFEKDALGKNMPSEKTIITNNHLIYYKGSAMKAKDFINNFENVKKIKYNGEVLYNVLLKDHDKMLVNNLICETLHPDNTIGELYRILSELSPTEQRKFIKEYNDYTIKNNIFSPKI